jgi:hypothetical protein
LSARAARGAPPAPPPPPPHAAAGGGAGAPGAPPPRAPPAGGRAPRRLLQGALLAGALVAGAAGATALNGALSSSDGGQRTERLDNGDQRTSASAHGVSIELTGPTEAPAGETVRLEAEVDGTETWQWVAPDGSIYPNQPAIELRPDSPGRGTARLLAVDDHGRIVQATHEVTITD